MRLLDFLAGLGVMASAAGAVPDRILAQITQDSRTVGAGDLFVARRGESLDGHAFVAAAVRRGATAVLAERPVDTPAPLWIVDARPTQPQPLLPPQNADAVAYILVNDSTAALEQAAAWWRRQLAVKVVGITGSVGKTSTKEMVAAVLSQRFAVLKSERSLNTDVGMALTLLRLEATHQQAVLEMGMYTKGEIAHLCRLAAPQLGIVTNIGPTHLERMGSIEAIVDAKSELLEALPAEGTAILNFDDVRVQLMAQRTQARIFSYGQAPGLDLWASDVESHGLDGIAFRLHYGADDIAVRSPLLGKHSVQTALAAAATALVLGMSWQEIVAGLSTSAGQLRLVVVTGALGQTIIDDSYNSSPLSCLAALGVLAETKGRHIAVLGDMLELGSFEDEGHRQVGTRAAQAAQVLLAVARVDALSAKKR